MVGTLATCYTRRECIPAFYLEGKSLAWWDLVKASRNFMGKYFLALARHAKDQEFLELKQGTMTVLEYVA